RITARDRNGRRHRRPIASTRPPQRFPRYPRYAYDPAEGRRAMGMRTITGSATPLALTFVIVVTFSGRRAAAEPLPSAADFFESRVRPVLVQHCFQCHSTTAEKIKGGLLLDTREGMLKGGDSGPAIVPGHPEKSRLIEAVRYANPDTQMPPKTR